MQVVHVPSNLGIADTAAGVALAPSALEELRLSERVGSAKRPIAVPVEITAGAQLTPGTRVLRAQAVVEHARSSARQFERLLQSEALPLIVVGGDCSIVFGPLLALQSMNQRAALLYLDGHISVYKEGEAADLDLSVIIGHAPEELGTLTQAGPLVRADNVLLIGPRDEEEARSSGTSHSLDSLDIKFIPAQVVIANPSSLLGRIRQFLEGREFDCLWIHFDVDVLDDAVMSAVDYRLPGAPGLSASLVSAILKYVWTIEPRLAGVTVAIYNPERDPAGRCGEELALILERAFSSAKTA